MQKQDANLRDVIVYGNRIPHASRPGPARIAVQFTLNHERLGYERDEEANEFIEQGIWIGNFRMARVLQ